ncbi:MAG TPA: hypothetical protein VGQ18_05400 [Gemmatimonadales bacterium]|nr:hypothetical protein [Gemmatimonadales bacterium]
MFKRAALASLFLVAACSDGVGPEPRLVGPSFATTSGSGIVLDQQSGVYDAVPMGSGTHIGKGFEPVNPHVGDAIVATFFWIGSTNTITQVTDHLSDAAQTPVGNTYTLVEYVTAGGISMATYVATNVQGFSDADTVSEKILAVHAIFSEPGIQGGVKISAWRGVAGVTAQALGAHRSASGAGSGVTVADPGSIPLDAGALAYAVTMSNGQAGFERPVGFTQISSGSNGPIVDDGEYAVAGAATSSDPQWTWVFNSGSQSTWLATVLALKPTADRLAFATQPSRALPFAHISPAVRVAVVDDQGNAITTFSGPVTVAIGRNGGLLLPGTLSGTQTVNAVNGMATFSDLSIDQLGNGYTLKASGAGLIGAESAPFNIGLF